MFTSLVSQAQLQFSPDGSFAQHGPGTWQSSGTFTVQGDKLVLTYPSTGRSSTFRIGGDTIYSQGGRAVWARQAAVAPEQQPSQPSAPPTAPPSIQLGQTIDQVVAVLGQPEKSVNLGSKQIYVYKDLKVTFVDGKVSDVQ
jgi:hypothetical protein